MIIDELITIFGFDVKDQEKLHQYTKNISSAVDELKTMATVATATFGAMLTGITAVNSETAKMANLADAVGMDYEIANTFNGIAKSIGLDGEHVVDMFEEMNNKVGESKAIYADWLKNDKGSGKELKLVSGLEDFLKGVDLSVMDEAFKGLNLEEKIKKLSTMSNSEQYKLYVGAAAMAKDAQVAASSLDILMGGEANKILMAYRKELERLGMTAKEYEKYKDSMNFLDKEAIASAKEYSRTIGDTKGMFATIGQQISAVAGKYLTPIIQKMNKWLILNKKIIQVKINKYIAIAVNVMKRLWNIINLVWVGIDKMANALGGWDVVLPILGAIMAYFSPWKVAIMAVLLVFDDLIAYFKGGKSVIGNFINYFKTEFPLLSSIIESLGDAWSSVFGFFKAIYDTVVKPIFQAFTGDAKSASSGLLGDFQGAFSAIGVVAKSFLEIVSNIFKLLTALISGDFEAVKEYASAMFNWLKVGFDGVVNFLSAGANIFKKVWKGAIDWIMSKIEWVSKKIDSAKELVGDATDAVGDVASSAVDSVANFFGFGDDEKKTSNTKETITTLKEKITNNTHIDRAKETINHLKESVTNNATVNNTKEMVNAFSHAPIAMAYAPVSPVSSVKNYNQTHKHNSSYNIQVTGVERPNEVAYAIKEQILDSKAIEKANVNRVVAPYGDK